MYLALSCYCKKMKMNEVSSEEIGHDEADTDFHEHDLTSSGASMEYDDAEVVRGPLVLRAALIERDLAKGVKKPFDRVVRATHADYHALGQKPITFLRQLLAVTAYPTLLTSTDIPQDIKNRAKEILNDCKHRSVGSFSPTRGLPSVRSRAVQYLTARDEVPACIDDIVLGNGISDLVRSVLQLLKEDINRQAPAVLVPCPEYPLFSGTISELGLRRAEYILHEEDNWVIQLDELERALRAARYGDGDGDGSSVAVRALFVINPGHPTGQILSKENIKEIIKFAYENQLLILADEVYLENIISKPFYSFKKVMHTMGAPYNSMPLVSFLTVSRGWAAESGLRGALVELLRMPQANVDAMYVARSPQQCSGVLEQVALYAVLNPPRPGEPSYPLFSSELRRIRSMLAARSQTAYKVFNSIPGYSCNTIDGAAFAYPRIEVPKRAVLVAKSRGFKPDEFYCMALLDQTGICVVPGSEFGQVPGTYHFCITITHNEHEFQYMMNCIRSFHEKFLQVYRKPNKM